MQELGRNMVQNGMASCSRHLLDTESADFDYITLFREEVIVAVPAFHPLAHRPKNTSMEFPQGFTRGAVRLSLYPYESGQ